MYSSDPASNSAPKEPNAAHGAGSENKCKRSLDPLRIEVQKRVGEDDYAGRTLKFGPHHFMLLRGLHTKEAMYSYKDITHISRLDQFRIRIDLTTSSVELLSTQTDDIVEEFMERCPYFCFSPFVIFGPSKLGFYNRR